MNAILVCVDMADLLSVCLPYNRHHFDRVTVVTSLKDRATMDVAEANHGDIHATDVFWERGANFNKWAALEQGLDAMGREGWLTIMDCDVLWPKSLKVTGNGKWLELWNVGNNREPRSPCQYVSQLSPGQLCTPLRRMTPWPCDFATLEDESGWQRFPLHPQQHEWAGYSQTFHCDDPHLSCINCGCPRNYHKDRRQGIEHPNLFTECEAFAWHQTDWSHCGGADSFFQARWPADRKVRPPFECLHLGDSGVNWCGRVTPLVDGSVPEGAEERRNQLRGMMIQRIGKQGMDRFKHERLP